ncbi:hypothetical protein K490DRAFT_66705 [Saccharata proteae CBS 121410]|uniref:Uncharacterized protein n=1 Tax=Saccharata proteae CBS 121410 TaxID=1314787 RepID=A0A9P4HTC5_9PEZI|nr:hypothetical protein K490DRAFT_66705 [Saccharata proteae CBS 121410]
MRTPIRTRRMRRAYRKPNFNKCATRSKRCPKEGHQKRRDAAENIKYCLRTWARCRRPPSNISTLTDSLPAVGFSLGCDGGHAPWALFDLGFTCIVTSSFGDLISERIHHDLFDDDDMIEPGENAPGEDTPEEKTPGENTLEENTPEEDTLEEDTPEEDTPEEDTPEENTLGENTPEEDMPASGALAGIAHASISWKKWPNRAARSSSAWKGMPRHHFEGSPTANISSMLGTMSACVNTNGHCGEMGSTPDIVRELEDNVQAPQAAIRGALHRKCKSSQGSAPSLAKPPASTGLSHGGAVNMEASGDSGGGGGFAHGTLLCC